MTKSLAPNQAGNLAKPRPTGPSILLLPPHFQFGGAEVPAQLSDTQTPPKYLGAERCQ